MSSRARSNFTTASCPYLAANDNGVWPCLSFEFGLTSSRARSNFTTASCPFAAANDNGVWPYEPFVFSSMSSRARSNSPLLHVHSQLPMTTASGHTSPSCLVRRHPARGAALPLPHAHCSPQLIGVNHHPCSSSPQWRHYLIDSQ